MRLHENIDFTTLTWVKPELDETLRQARNALQNYVEEGESPAELRTCSDLLHQVQGTLRMVELYGAAMVAEEMEQLSRALVDGKVENRDNAYAVLMQGIVQLPDYLERLQSGHRDIPIVLLPLLNQLRESRGEKGLNESVLFSPDLSRPLPPSAQGPGVPLEHAELTRRAEALRGLFQGALLRWLKDDNSAATIRDLTDVCEQLVPITAAEPARRLFWVAAGTLDALGRNAFPISNPLKQALAKVEREIKRLADGGDAAFRSDPPIELTKQLLYFVAHEGSDVGRIGEIRKVFGLSGSEPSEAELAHARGSLSGNNRALLETVAVAIKDDLLRVKDSLDLHLRTPGAKPADLNAQVEALDRVADTLGMLGLAVPRRVVQDQRSAITDVINGQRRDDEETLLDIAGALLYVEAALDDQVERLGKEGADVSTDTATGTSNESRRLLEVLVKEAIVNFSQARQSFVGFVETHWDHRQLVEVPRLLSEVSGALRILNLPLPADYLVGVRQFTDNELLRRKHVPSGQQMDRLADALASLEYFLEALRDRRPNRDQILEVARQSLTSLGYWPLSAENRAAAPTAAPTPISKAPAPAAQPSPVESEAAPQAPAMPAETAAAASPAAPAFDLTSETRAPETVFTGMVGDLVPGFDGASSEEIDDEIREVFLEEFEEEIENLAQLLPPWREDPSNAELLRPIRRVFHTLKGSGRLVGAKTLGEFSWKIEGLLNRVLDGSRPATPEVVAMVQLALQHLPLLRAALQGQEVFADLEGIQATADQVAAGEDVTYRHASMAEEPAIADADEDMDEQSVEAVAEAEIAAPEEAVAQGEDEGPLFSIDPVLLEILKPEVAGHLEVVDAWLAQCAARGPQPVTDPLLRSIHTMNGAFAMTEVLAITEVTAPLEGFVKRSLAHNLNPGEAGVALVADAAKAIRATILAIEKPRPVLPHFADLSARAYSLRDTLPDSMLPSVPVHAEEDLSSMPQVVVMEAADTSGIPDFEGMAEAADAAGVAEVEAEAEAEADAVAEAEVEAEVEPVADIPAEAELEIEVEAAAEAEAEAEAELEAEMAVEVEAPAEVEPQFVDETTHEFEREAEMEAAQYLGSDAFIEPTIEPEAVPEAEAMPELESRADSWITGEYEIASIESPAAPAVEVEASSRTIVELAADEPMQWSEEFQAEQATFEAEAAQALADVPTESFSSEQALEAQAQAEAADFAEEFELAEFAAVEELAPAEAEMVAEVQAEEEFDLATEAEAVAQEAEEEDEQVAYAELFSADLISVEDFLREAGEREAADAEAAAAEAAAAEAAAAEAAAAEAAAAEAAAAEAAAAEAAAAEAAAAEAAAAEAAAAEAAAAEAAAAEAAAAEAAAAEAAAAEAAAAEAAAAEAAAAEAAEAAAAEAAAAEAAEAAAAEAAFAAESLTQPAEESLDALSDSALAGMIAAYSTDEEAQAVANIEAGDEFILSDEFRDDIAASEAMAGSGGERVAPASMQGDADAPATVQVAIGDEYYGMSLAELEALTSPDATPMAEADGFADMPTIAGVPAWTSGKAREVEAEPESPAAEFLELAPEFADLEALASSNFELDVGEPEAAPASDFEAVAAFDFVEEAPELIAEVEAFTESAEVAEDQPLGEVEEFASLEEAEPAPEPEAAVEPEVAAEPEAVAEIEVVAEPEVVAEIEEEAELVFEDSPEEIAEAAVAASPEVAAAAPVRQQRPSVPMAADPDDPDAELDMSDLDPELLDLFLEESNDILDQCDGVLARLREQAEDRDSIVSLQRELHTLKGGARMAGIYAVGELGHAMESLLESVAEGRQQLDQTGVVVLERGFDRLHGMVARIGERKAVATPVGLIAQVEALSEGRSLDQAVGADTVAPTTSAPVRPRVETTTLEALSAPLDELGAEDEMTGVRAPQEQVRIRADLLDRLVNYAGEVAIYRARLEQQLGAFRSNLGELNQTTTRLREQLRRLDIETEAQIIARYQREGEANDERFDPLELDRFTNQQQLTRALNESANDLVNLQGVLDELTRQYETLLLQQSRVSSDLQEGLMRTRMVPFDALVPRLRRVLRQAATDTGKQVQLKVDGASGEMDRNVLDRMTAPLEHMLRNAMAHGLELPDVRRKAGKPEEGTVRIAVHREGSEVVLKVSDDGIGLNKKAIRDKALERGLIKADAELSDEALYSLILETGFSTAETVSRLSGRGVGMDVVYSEIRQLGGTLQIKSDEGKGSEFVIRLPFTLAVTQAVFVKIGDTSFAVPIASVQGVGRIARADLDKQLATDNPVFNYAGEDYAIHDLGTLIGHAPAKAQDSLQMPLLLARSGELRTAISIDQVMGSREIVVKPVGPQVNSVPGIFGATIMGDGRVVVILDVAPLVRRQTAIIRDITPVAPAPVVAARRVPVVMVVDDSITMRKVTGRVLERNNMEVLTAKDGVDAVEKMAERVPDLVLLDIEMPRMDGYEVAQNMKSDPRLKDVPIIMITSRTGEKHRQRAMDIGVDRYLGKPYQEPELMRNVFEMLGLEAVNG